MDTSAAQISQADRDFLVADGASYLVRDGMEPQAAQARAIADFDHMLAAIGPRGILARVADLREPEAALGR